MYLTILELAEIGGQNVVYHMNQSSLVGGVILSLCREVFPREHLSIERIVQHTVLLWRSSHLILDIISLSERSLGTAPTEIR